MAQLLTDTRALDAESKAILDESEVVQGLIRQTIRENASTPLKQDEYTLRFNALYDRQTALRDRNAQIENERVQRKIKRERILAFIDRLRAADCLLTEFDEGLWNATVESVTVQPDGGLRFQFRDGRILPMNETTVVVIRIGSFDVAANLRVHGSMFDRFSSVLS